MPTDMTVSNTILKQIGGCKFRAMTGAHDFTGFDNGLGFKLPSSFAKKGINYIKITLNECDIYDTQFLKIRGMKITPILNVDGVYADMLQDMILAATGLRLSLGGR
jgi:hypothetical protein